MATTTAEIRVLVVDPRALVRRGLRLVVNREQRMAVVAEAGTLDDAVAAADAHPDVAVLDGDLLGRSGASAVAAMRAAVPGVRLLVLTGGAASERQALRAGADAVLPKRRASEDVTGAIRALSDAETRAAERPHRVRGAVAAVAALGPADREVLRLVALGHSTAAIARHLGCAAAEVDRRRRAVTAAVGAASRADLVRLAGEAGLTGQGA
ncbi:MAG: response regulator transcription factor [Thermoleophilia bacterium]|nr:response regulator transcription factor [Thermoleophilia bacterium]